MNAGLWREGSLGRAPEGGRSLRRRVPAWVKLALIAAFLACLGWLLFIIIQYFLTHQPIDRLPGVPSRVGDLFARPPQYLRSIPEVRRPLGVAVSGDGNVYVTESGGERMIRVYDSAGREIASFAPPGTAAASRVPVYVAIGPSGDVYVSDRDAGTIYIFSAGGVPLGRVPSPLPQEEAWHPLGLTFDALGNLYVTDVTPGKHRVLVLGGDGSLKLQFGKQGSAAGEFWYPNAVAIDGQARIYVSDSNNGRVQVFDSTGRYLHAIARSGAAGGLSLPRGLAIDDEDHLFVADTSRQLVQVYDVSEAPRLLHAFGGAPGSASEFRYPNGLALDGQGGVYVTDREHDRVQIWKY